MLISSNIRFWFRDPQISHPCDSLVAFKFRIFFWSAVLMDCNNLCRVWILSAAVWNEWNCLGNKRLQEVTPNRSHTFCSEIWCFSKPCLYLSGGVLLLFFFFPFLKTKEKNILKLTVWWSPEGCFSVGRVWKQQHAMQVYALGNIGCCAEQCPALLGTNPCLPVTLQFPFCSAVFKSWKYDLCLLTPLWCCSALTTWWKSRTPPS